MYNPARTLLIPLLVLLAACEFRTKDALDASADEVSAAGNSGIEEGLTIDTPLFEGRINLPGAPLGANMDLDGIKLHPRSKVVGINVDASGAEGSEVRIGFTSEEGSQAVLDYYRDAATGAGFKLDPLGSGGATLSGTKGDNRFELTVAGTGGGTTGTLVMSDG